MHAWRVRSIRLCAQGRAPNSRHVALESVKCGIEIIDRRDRLEDQQPDDSRHRQSLMACVCRERVELVVATPHLEVPGTRMPAGHARCGTHFPMTGNRL